jgi:hypothetical protein
MMLIVQRHRYQTILPAPSVPAHRPSNASFPHGNFSSLVGWYDNPGYGPFELCLVAPKDPNPSPSCKALAANINTVLPGTVMPEIPTFFAKWDSLWFSHLRITHFDGVIFNVSMFGSHVSRDSSIFDQTHKLTVCDADTDYRQWKRTVLGP